MVFKHLPQQLTLQEEDRNEAKVMLGLKANKKLLQNHLSKKSGNVVILKDLHNLSSSSSPILLRFRKLLINLMRNQVNLKAVS